MSETAKALRDEARKIVADAQRRAERLLKLASAVEDPTPEPATEAAHVFDDEERARRTADIVRRMKASGQF